MISKKKIASTFLKTFPQSILYPQYGEACVFVCLICCDLKPSLTLSHLFC